MIKYFYMKLKNYYKNFGYGLIQNYKSLYVLQSFSQFSTFH